MPRTPLNRLSGSALLALMLLVGPTSAQEDPFSGFGDLAGSRAATPRGPRVVEPPRPFVLGRDNLGFPNPWGAVQLQGMAGNCYAMSAVTRLFYEGAEYREAAGEPGIDWPGLAASLRGKSGYRPRFLVRGYPSLHAMSHPEGMPRHRIGRWMEAAARHELGVEDEAPGEVMPENGRAVLDLYQLVSVVHYLHYMQFQSPGFLRSAVLDRLQGPSSHRRANREATEAVLAGLPRGDLALLMVFNPQEVYGHVVLAYRAEVREDGSTDLYYYDNNVQYGAMVDETLFRVSPGGDFHPYRRRADDGELVDDEQSWAGSRFWDRDRMSLHVLPDLNDDPALRRSLADKIEHRQLETAYLMLSGEYLEELTRESPQDLSLFESTRRFILRIQQAQEALDGRPSWRHTELAADASVEELNAYLARYTDRGLGDLIPYVLPDGLALTGTRLRFDPEDPNRAELATTLTLDHAQPIEDVVLALRDSVALGSDPAVASLVREATRTFSGERAVLSVRVRLDKGRSPDPTIGAYAPVPTLLGSRVTLGSIRPTPHRVGFEGHMVEFSESLVSKLLVASLESQDLLHKRYEYDYSVDLPLGRRLRRVGRVTGRDAGVDYTPGYAELWAKVDGFAPVLTESRGVSFGSDRLAIRLTARVLSGNRIRLAPSLSGPLDFEAGFGRLGDRMVIDVLGALFRAVFPRVEDGIEKHLEGQLSEWAVLSDDSSIEFGRPRVSSRGISARVEPLTLDLDGTLERLFGEELPVELRSLVTRDDRIVLRFEPR